jgi:hypothetical protein
MSAKQCDSSSDSESSDVLEGTPVKEDNNKTLIMGLLASKQTQSHTSLSHSTPRYIGNESKPHAIEKEYHSPEKGKKLGVLRSSSSLQAHVSTDEESDEFTAGGRRHRRYAIESTDSETSHSMGDSLLDTKEGPLCSVKPALKVGKHRQRRNVMLVSDSDGNVTEEAESLVVVDSPELLKPVPAKGSDKKKKCTIYSSDSDASDDTPTKSVTAGKYRNCKFIVSSDSETSSFIEDSPSASDSSSHVTTPDKNAAVGTVLREAESSNADGRRVLETSISRKVIVQHRGCKSPVHNVVEVSDTSVKTVEDDDSDSSVQTNKVSTISLLT